MTFVLRSGISNGLLFMPLEHLIRISLFSEIASDETKHYTHTQKEVWHVLDFRKWQTLRSIACERQVWRMKFSRTWLWLITGKLVIFLCYFLGVDRSVKSTRLSWKVGRSVRHFHWPTPTSFLLFHERNKYTENRHNQRISYASFTMAT